MDVPGHRFGRAVVMGGSMAGLLSARALADHFEKVVILERDSLPGMHAARKGAPQGTHVHVMLDAGHRLLERFFPGLLQDLQDQGAALIDSSRDVAWHHFGVWKSRVPQGLPLLVCTRPFLEWHVLRRVLALPNVEFHGGVSVEGLLTDASHQRVTGVRLKKAGVEEPLEAALVVDATGRGSRAPQWLEALGHARPDEEQVRVDLAYTTRLYEPPAHRQEDWKVLMQYPCPPVNWRAGFISRVEGDRWIVTLNGYFGEHAPADDEGFLAFARSLPQPDLYACLREARPLGPLTLHKVKESRWRHYERLARFPENWIILGDAVCAFNPVFGQGMSVAAQGAAQLLACIEEQARRFPTTLDGLAQRFRKRLSDTIRLPWFMGTNIDLQYPKAVGQRKPGVGVLHWYIRRMMERSSRDAAVHRQFNRLLHLQAGLGAVLQPSVALPVLADGARALFMPLHARANTDIRPAPPSSSP
ncbi:MULTISPECIES: FAD-dependent oxidoreductase [Myxococcus]|uniref:FAD-dependent oxidoreductase n=1 Tax=Myxococcus TaxID=32 RepID=UPI0002D8D288|nr:MULTISPECIES: FAD-dependent oxidoreductase [Myxococcus]NOJ55415.1 FAD-dependent oxidoreductase [Myxococcus xanthus]QPM80373.1 FAD-dependent oxidoreductase [Myxococcus xanthus]QVW69436.1 FAD-dependent oxidoreductase [Myxococcus xanthus DZ2]UEO04438.1 FAD-dependent oxidoreductase [Myxococcus xanthus DZ2]UYI15354.1 FAD-dependent oxidoreductase [Myxococcus xanthus]